MEQQHAEGSSAPGKVNLVMPAGCFNPFLEVRKWAPVPSWLLERKEVGSTAKLVYARLLQHAGQDGLVFPSVPTLAREVGVSTRTAQRALRELEEQSLLLTQPRDNSSSAYWFQDHPWKKGATPPSDCHHPPVNLTPPPPSKCHPEENHKKRTKEDPDPADSEVSDFSGVPGDTMPPSGGGPTCPVCRGYGGGSPAPGAAWLPCSRCGGTGQAPPESPLGRRNCTEPGCKHQQLLRPGRHGPFWSCLAGHESPQGHGETLELDPAKWRSRCSECDSHSAQEPGGRCQEMAWCPGTLQPLSAGARIRNAAERRLQDAKLLAGPEASPQGRCSHGEGQPYPEAVQDPGGRTGPEIAPGRAPGDPKWACGRPGPADGNETCHYCGQPGWAHTEQPAGTAASGEAARPSTENAGTDRPDVSRCAKGHQYDTEFSECPTCYADSFHDSDQVGPDSDQEQDSGTGSLGAADVSPARGIDTHGPSSSAPCPVCGKTYRLRKDGRVMRHRRYLSVEEDPENRYETCPGSGQLPVGTAQEQKVPQGGESCDGDSMPGTAQRPPAPGLSEGLGRPLEQHASGGAAAPEKDVVARDTRDLPEPESGTGACSLQDRQEARLEDALNCPEALAHETAKATNRAFREWWDETWALGRLTPLPSGIRPSFVWDAKHNKAVDTVRKKAKGDLEEMKRRARIMLEHPHSWVVNNASPALLMSRWNELAAEPRSGNGRGAIERMRRL